MAENKGSVDVDLSGIDLSEFDLSGFKEESSDDVDLSDIDLSGFDLSGFREDDDSDPLKKNEKEESVLEEPLPDSSTNIIGQTSTEADTLEQEVPERPLIYRHGDYDPLGVTQREEPKDYSQADIQEDTQGDPILQSLQEYGEEPVEIDFDEGIANAITTAGLDREVDFTESPFVGRGMSGASQRQEVDENLKEDIAWNYFQERYRQVPPDQLLLLEGALERNAPNKYAQYRLKKHRAAKDRADQEWTMPEDTREYLELKNEYGQSDEMLKLLKEGKNQAVLDMLSNLDKQGLLNESQSKGVQKILSSEDTEDKTLEIGGTFAPAPQMPQQKRWNFPIDSKATTSFLRELVKEGDYFEDDIKPDDNSFTRGRKGFKHALHITNLALSKDKEDVIGALEYTRQKNFRKKPEQKHDLLSMQGIGEMAGGVADQTAATLGAGFLASAVGTPLAGTVASVATSTGMSAYQGYGQSLEEAYNKGRDMGLSKEKAYELAESQAMVGSALSGVEGFAGGLVGAKLPTKGFLGQAMSVAKDILVEGGVAGGSKMLQNWYGESLGLDYTAFEGVPENILGEVMFGVGMGAGNLSAKGFHNRFIKLPREEKLKTLAKLDQMIAIEAQRNPNIIEVALPQETPVEMTPKGGERMSIYEIADKQKGTKDASLSEIKARVLTPEESLEAQKDRDIQTVKDAIAEAERTGQVPMVNGREVSEATIDEINIDYEQKLAKLQQETDAAIQPTDVEEGLDTETTGTEAPPVEQEVKPTVEEKVEPEEDIEFDVDELAVLEKEIEASEGQGSLLDNLGQRAFMGGEEGMIRTHPEEPNTIIFETNERIIDLSKTDFETKKKKDMQEAQDKIDELENMSDEDAVKKYGKDGVKERDKSIKKAKEYKEGLESEKLLSDFDISLMSPEGVVVLPKGETVEVTRTAKGKTETSTVEVDVMDSDGQKYQIEYERRPKKGSRFVRAKNVENGQVKVFKGEQAERILKGIDLREGKVLKASKLKDDPTQSTDVKERLVSEKTPQKGTTVTQELEGTEPTVRAGEGIREGDQTATRGDVEAAIKRLEQDIEDTKNKVFQEREQRAREAEERLIASKKREQEANVKRAKERDLTPEQRKQKALSEQQVLDKQKKVVEALVEKQKLFADAREIWDSLTPDQRTKIEEQFDDLIKIYDEEAKIFEDLVNAEAKKKKRLKEDIVEAEFEFKDRKGNVVKGKGEFEVRQEGNTTKVFEIVDGKTIPLDAKPPETENLIEVGDAMFQVRKKADGTLTVSQANEKNKFVTVSKYKDGKGNPLREKVEALFRQEEARQQEEFFLQQKKKAAARRAFKEAKDLQYVKTEIEAEAEIDAFKKGQQDETLKKLDKLIAEAGQEFRDGLARSRGQFNMFWQAVGDFSKLSVPAVKYIALQMVKAGYKAKKGLSVAIKETYDYLKSKDLYTGSETQFKKWAIGKLKDGEPKAKGDTDPKAKTKGTGRAGTTKTKDTDGGQDKGKQPRTEGEDTEGDDVLSKEKPTVQKPSTEIDKILDAPDLKNKGLTDEELNRKTELEGLIKEAEGDAKKDLQAEYDALKAKQKEFDDNYLKKFSTVRKAYNEIKSAFSKGKRGERTDIVNRLSQVKTALRQFIKENKDSFKKVEGADVPSISTKINNLNPRAKDLEGEIDRVVSELEAILVKAEDKALIEDVKNGIKKLSKRERRSKYKKYRDQAQLAKSLKNSVRYVRDKASLAEAINKLNSTLSPMGKSYSNSEIQALLDKASDSMVDPPVKDKAIQDAEVELLKNKTISDDTNEILDAKIKEFIDIDQHDLSPEVAEKVKQIATIPLDGISKRQKIDLAKALEIAVLNDSDQGIQAFVDMAKGRKLGKDIANNISPIKKSRLREWNESGQRYFASFTNNLDAMANNTKEASLLNQAFLQPFSLATADANNALKNMLEPVSNIYHKMRKAGKDIDSLENDYERSVYSFLSMYETDASRLEDFANSKQLIKQTVEYYKRNPDAAKEKDIDINALDKVWNKYKDAEASDIDNIVSKDNKDIIQTWVDTREKNLKDDLFRHHELHSGETLSDIKNSVAVRVINTSEDVPEVGGIDDVRPSEFISGLIPVQSSSRKKRKIKYGKDSILDLNFNRVQERSMKESLDDIHLNPAIAQVNGALASPEMKAKLGKERLQTIKKQADSYVKKQRGEIKDKDEAFITRVMSKVSNLGYASTLGTPEQALNQSIPVALSAAINLGNDSPLLFTASKLLVDPKTRKVMNDILSRTDIGQRGFKKVENPETHAEISRSSNKFARAINSKMAKLGFKQKVDPTEIALIFTELGDKAIAKSSWLAYYMSDLKKQGIDISNTGLSSSQKKRKATLEKQLETAEGKKDARLQMELYALLDYESKSWTGEFNKEAAAYASHQVSKTQNISDVNESSKFMNDLNKNAIGQFAKRTIFSYKSFALNNKARLFNDIAKGNVRGIIGAITEEAAFSYMSGYIGSGVVGLLTSMSFDDDDKEPKYTRHEKGMNKMIKNLVGLPNPVNVAGNLGEEVSGRVINEVAAGLNDQSYADYMNDKPIYVPFEGSDWLGVMGAGGELASEVYKDLNILMFDNVTRNYGRNYVEKSTEAAETAALSDLLLTALVTTLPVAGAKREVKKHRERMLGKEVGSYSDSYEIDRSSDEIYRGSDEIDRSSDEIYRGSDEIAR